MHLPRPSTLQGKFLGGLAIASLFLGVLFAAGFYLHMKNVLEEEVRDKAELIFAQVDAVQTYVRQTLRPAMYDELPTKFIIQAMSSSYISRAVMDRMQGGDGRIYRRVAESSRNPSFEANEMEQELIEYFRGHPEQKLWKGYRQLANKEYYVMARPVTFTESCMRCHGDPEDAPKELIEQYGNRGFWRDQDTIGGVDVVGLSVASSVSRLQATIIGYFAFFMLGAVVFFSTTNVLFKLLVVNNIKRLSRVFHRNMADTDGTDLLERLQQGDEIEELEAGMQELNNHLYAARAKLKDYADNLKHMVDERTEELTREAKERRADVDLFVQLLADMRSSKSRSDLWRRTLPQIHARLGANRVAYVCTFVSQNFFSYPPSPERPPLPENYVTLLTDSKILIEQDRAYVPVESSAGNAEGLLCLFWENGNMPTTQDPDLLQALGRQLGTVAENLGALNNLMRQMDTLQAIVEGISDPLMLMNASCNLILANQAARDLASELTNGSIVDGNILSPLMGYEPGEECPMTAAIAKARPHTEEVTLEGRSFSLNLYPVIGTDDSEKRVVVYARETTMEKRMLSRMQQSEKMITVGKLAAGVAHEINNPLGVILCYAELLRQNTSEPQQHQDLDVILKHTRQAQRVLQDLLNFARPKTAVAVADMPASTDAGLVAINIREVFQLQATKRSINLMTSARPGHVSVALGEHELEQVLSNLVLNALDAVEDISGEVMITVEREANDALIIVADNGHGIPDDLLARVFDPFFTTKDQGEGTGLGLAVVYGMITEAGGTVESGTSNLLGGAEFTIRLPLTEAQE